MARRLKPRPPPDEPLVTPAPDPILNALHQQQAELAEARKGGVRSTFPEFLKRYPPAPEYIWGRHTRAIAEELNLATETVEKGGKYYVVISLPPRHGKSDQASRRYPAWHLTRNPDHEAILATYSAELSEYLSRATRKCFEESAPAHGLRLSKDMNQVGAWTIEGHRGGMFAMGLGGTITGRGANVLIIDDYCKNRAEAESETVRTNVWDSFRSDLMTRLAPAHAVIVIATRWHEDDLAGRIFEEMKKDAKFPHFKQVNFPALAEDGSFLFPERFPAEWYEAQRAAVGAYAWQSLYQGDPKPRAGRMLRGDLVEIVTKAPELKWVRGWDLASTEKERIKDDPDYTVGVKVGFDGDCLWIVDVVRGQWSAPERDKRMEQTALRDGRGVEVRIETVAGYKDTYTRIKHQLSGKATVRATQPRGDKVSEASILEPLFEAGKVKLLKAPWNDAFIAEVNAFPRGKNDDQVDATKIGAKELLSSKRRMGLSA
jgi:predicted phage terminase large subunit-like protein